MVAGKNIFFSQFENCDTGTPCLQVMLTHKRRYMQSSINYKAQFIGKNACAKSETHTPLQTYKSVQTVQIHVIIKLDCSIFMTRFFLTVSLSMLSFFRLRLSGIRFSMKITVCSLFAEGDHLA